MLILTCGLNWISSQQTRVEMDCTTGVLVIRRNGYINESVRGLMRDTCACTNLWVSLGWNTLWSVTLVGTQIWSGVSWFWWQLVKAIWHGFREASIHVGCTKTGILEPHGAIPPGSNLPWRGLLYCLAPEVLLFSCNADEAWGVFGAARHIRAMALCPDPPVGCTTNTNIYICKIEVKCSIVS